MQQQASSLPRSTQELKGAQQGLERHITLLASDGAGSEAAPQLPSDGQPQLSEAAEAAAQAAAEEAVAALSDDEAPLEPPQDPRKMGEAHFLAAAKLRKDRGRGRQPRAILDLLNMAIAAQPDRAEMYHDRAVVHMELGRDKEAVQDFTVALSLPDCSAHLRYQCLLFRGRCRMDVGDLPGADADYKAAQDAAEDDRQRKEAQDYRGFLLMERVRRRKAAVERSKRRPAPVQHRYRTAVIEELEPEEGTPEQEEAVAHERAQAWEEAALSLAVEAKGRASRVAREHLEEQARVREENEARRERNEVRAARRRSVAKAAAARARAEAQRAAQQAAAQPVVLVKERTEIPIEMVDSAAEPPAPAAAGSGDVQASSSGDSSRSSSRSTASRLAGYASEPESTEVAEGEEASAVAAASEAAAGTPAPAAGEAPAAAWQRSACAPAEAEPVAARGDGGAAAERQAAPQLPATAMAAPAAVAGEQAAVQPPQQEAQTEAQAVRPAQGLQPLISEEGLDRMKDEADRLQLEGQADAAEGLYARYLRHRPADQRVWGNRAENFLKAARWTEVLEFCNEALAIASPTHEAKRFKIFARRAAAYHGLGRLQEALRDYEAADVAAEAAGEWKPKKTIAKRICEVLAEMESKGIQVAPSGPGMLGMQAAAAAASVQLPPMPVTPLVQPLAPPEETELEPPAAAAGAQDEAASGGGGAAAAAAAPGATPPAVDAKGEGALSPGAALTAASHQARIRAEEAAAAKQASAEAREKGNNCFQKHQWEQALRHYRRASELDPGCKLALANQAAALLKLERWGEAEDLAGQALAIDCGFTKARYRRARAYYHQGNLELAVMDMELAVGADPADKAAQRELKAMKAALAQEQARLGLAGMHMQANSLYDDPSASE